MEGNLFSSNGHQQAVAKREIGILKLGGITDRGSIRTLLEKLSCYAELEWRKEEPPGVFQLRFKQRKTSF